MFSWRFTDELSTSDNCECFCLNVDAVSFLLFLLPICPVRFVCFQVGIIFSHKLREAVLSGYDIVTVSEMQNQVEDKFGVDISKGFVILTVAQNEDGTIQFNSYQLSDQCLEMARKGVFAPADAQRRNSAKVKLNPEGWVLYKDKKRSFKHYKVLVENAETDTVPSEFFLINVAIQSHKSWLRTLFPVENREIAPQMMEDASKKIPKSVSVTTQKETVSAFETSVVTHRRPYRRCCFWFFPPFSKFSCTLFFFCLSLSRTKYERQE